MFDRSKIAGSLLAIVAFLVIGYVIIQKYNPNLFLSEFSNNDYFIPSYSDKNEDARNAYLKMGGKSGSETCPVVVPERTKYGTIDITAIDSKYQKMYWVLSNQEVNKDAPKSDSNDFILSKVRDKDGLLALKKDAKEFKVGETKYFTINESLGLLPDESLDSKEGYYLLGKEKNKLTNYKNNKAWQIIAPWDYEFFECNNIDRNPNSSVSSNSYSTTIKIQNADGTQRLTFTGVVNWYCAGLDTKAEGWATHWNNHKTVIGSSKNSKFRGGHGGTVLGFIQADRDPKLSIEVLEDNTWKSISVAKWLFDDDSDTWQDVVKKFSSN